MWGASGNTSTWVSHRGPQTIADILGLIFPPERWEITNNAPPSLLSALAYLNSWHLCNCLPFRKKENHSRYLLFLELKTKIPNYTSGKHFSVFPMTFLNQFSSPQTPHHPSWLHNSSSPSIRTSTFTPAASREQQHIIKLFINPKEVVTIQMFYLKK